MHVSEAVSLAASGGACLGRLLAASGALLWIAAPPPCRPDDARALQPPRGKDIAQGTGLTNMMRQLGGSFGVALIATFVQKRSWTHRQSLLAHVSIYDAPVRERLDALIHGFVAKGSTLLEAQCQAYGALEGTVARQTFLLTYMDAFRIVGLFFLFCIPLLLLFKRGRGAPPPVSVH